MSTGDPLYMEEARGFDAPPPDIPLPVSPDVLPHQVSLEPGLVSSFCSQAGPLSKMRQAGEEAG